MTVARLSRRDALRRIGAGAAMLAGAAPLRALAAPPDALQRVRERGALTVGLYNDMPPFEGVLTQEAFWAIKSWLETRREKPLAGQP